MSKTDPIKLMYTAIMQISFVSSEFYTDAAALERIKEIADEAMRYMNSEHTKLVQDKVFEFGKLKR